MKTTTNNKRTTARISAQGGPRSAAAAVLCLAVFGEAALATSSYNYTADETVSSLPDPDTVTVAAGATVTVTGDVTSTGDTTSARFEKAGDGTLVLQGDNTFKRLKHSAGALVFDGGATTVSGGSGANQVGDGGNFFIDGDEFVITVGANVTVGAASTAGTQYPILSAVSTVINNGKLDLSVNTAQT
ncbi:MAG: autotransporter-associated beta strand repeat-containing protein, partial [Kiritimatiellae bacterium]|nr:autotransporter-associated beta strand repeat-containing protein [Kiritimatiellia bacterium]